MQTSTIENGITEQEGWLIAADDILWTVSELLPKLSAEARGEITKQLSLIGPGYDSWEDLAARARNTSDHINPEN